MKIIKTLFSVCILVSISLNAYSQDLSISGSVKLKSSATGLAYVHVQISKEIYPDIILYSAVTDEVGAYTFNKLNAGIYNISVSHMGYHPQRMIVDLKETGKHSIDFILVPALIPLGEVSVSSLRYNRKEREVSLPLSVIPRENIPRQSSMTLSDVLEREPGVSLYREGVWSTSVSVRGLGANRLVSLIDGNRIETATDLVAGLSMIDVNEIERVEVLKGAASSIYGTGAMGGVINIITRNGDYRDKFGIQGEAIGQYESANSLLGGHVSLDAGDKKWKARISGGYRTAGDIKTPEGILDNSQFSDQNMNASFSVRPLENHEISLNYQDYRAMDVGIPGGAPFGPTVVASYPLATRRLVTGKYKINNISPVLSELSIRYYNQYISRDVKMNPNMGPVLKGNFRITANEFLPKGEHYTQGVVLESKLHVNDNHRLVAGIDLWQRELVTSREKYITQEVLDDFQMVVKTLEIVRGEKPIPDSKFGSAGLFVQDEFSLMNNKLDLTLGARIDRVQVSSDMAVDPVFLIVNDVNKDPVPGQRVIFNEQSLGAWSWSAHASGMYHLSGDLDLVATIGRSFRSPSLEERFKYIDLGSKVRLGDPELDPEKSLFADLGMRYWRDDFNIKASGFVHKLNDMIVEMPGEFVYRLSAEEGVGITDTLPALINTNIDKALLTGAEVSVNASLFPNFVLTGQAAYVRGINLTTDGSLPLIPPFSATIGARYHIMGSFVAEWNTRYFASQKQIAPGETETEGYMISEASVYSLPKQFGLATFQIFAGVDNIFNKSYVNHLATNRGLVTAEPGRNVFIKIKMNF